MRGGEDSNMDQIIKVLASVWPISLQVIIMLLVALFCQLQIIIIDMRGIATLLKKLDK